MSVWYIAFLYSLVNGVFCKVNHVSLYYTPTVSIILLPMWIKPPLNRTKKNKKNNLWLIFSCVCQMVSSCLSGHFFARISRLFGAVCSRGGCIRKNSVLHISPSVYHIFTFFVLYSSNAFSRCACSLIDLHSLMETLQCSAVHESVCSSFEVVFVVVPWHHL